MIHLLLGQYLEFAESDGLHIAYLDSTRCWQQFGAENAHVGSFKSRKNEFLNDPKCQKGGFLDLGLLDRLGIAYDDRNKWVPTFRNHNSSWMIIQKCQKCIFEWSKVPKRRFLALFLGLVCWIELALYIVFVLNTLQHLAM